jgi:predicted KAP-like P-loop ATPase
MSSQEATPHPFSADRPIEKASDDVLDRADFAKALADAVKGWAGRDSLVIALYGDWGSGKTSIKNIMLEFLRSESAEIPIVEFNPWQWSGQERVFEGFFHEVGAAIGKRDSQGRLLRGASKWQEYAAALKVASAASQAIKTILNLSLVAFLVLGAAGQFIEPASARLIYLAFAVLAFVGLVFNRFGDFADRLANFLTVRAERAARSIESIKRELKAELQDRDTPILVVIDDLDRLDAEEIRLVMQLVKANADFPNLVYLVLCQREVLERYLGELAADVGHAPALTGREFLEKIVQVGFTVPAIDRGRLEKVLFTDLNNLLEKPLFEERFSAERWPSLYVMGLRPYFQTLRDVRRFIATFSFHLSFMSRSGTLEVDPVDLIAMEVLRVFEPTVYDALPGAKSVVTTGGVERFGDKDKSLAKKTIDTILARASGEHKEAGEHILRETFPRIEPLFGGMAYGSESDEEWYRQLRVCHPDVFDRYFHFAIPLGDISQAEIELILNSANNRDELVSVLRALHERGLLIVALDRLEAFKQKMPLDIAVPFVTAIFDVSDKLPNEMSRAFELGPDVHALRIVFWYLMQDENQQNRAAHVREAVTATSGVYLPAMLISREYAKKQEGKPLSERLISEEDLDDLRNIWLSKVREVTVNPSFAGHNFLAYVLRCWRKFGANGEARAWVENEVGTKEGALRFLSAMLLPYRLNDKLKWRIRLSIVEEFVSPDTVLEKIKDVDVDKLDERQRLAVEKFNEALDERARGVSEDSLEWR